MNQMRVTCEVQSTKGICSSLSWLVLLAGRSFPEHAQNWKFPVHVAFSLDDPHQNLLLLGKIVFIISQK